MKSITRKRTGLCFVCGKLALNGGQVMRRVGKHSAGRLLDGVEHNGVPA